MVTNWAVFFLFRRKIIWEVENKKTKSHHISCAVFLWVGTLQTILHRGSESNEPWETLNDIEVLANQMNIEKPWMMWRKFQSSNFLNLSAFENDSKIASLFFWF